MNRDGKIRGVILTPRTLSRIRMAKSGPLQKSEIIEEAQKSSQDSIRLNKPKPLVSSYAQNCKRKTSKTKVPKKIKPKTPHNENQFEDKFLQTGTLLTFIPSKYAYQEIEEEHSKIRDRALYLSEKTESLKERRRNERLSASTQRVHDTGFDSKKYNETLSKIFFESTL